MDYLIEKKNQELKIQVEAPAEKSDELLENFALCQQGKCNCPTSEYEKLDSMTVERENDQIRLSLKSKPGTEISEEEVKKCLDITLESVSGKK